MWKFVLKALIRGIRQIEQKLPKLLNWISLTQQIWWTPCAMHMMRGLVNNDNTPAQVTIISHLSTEPVPLLFLVGAGRTQGGQRKQCWGEGAHRSLLLDLRHSISTTKARADYHHYVWDGVGGTQGDSEWGRGEWVAELERKIDTLPTKTWWRWGWR